MRTIFFCLISLSIFASCKKDTDLEPPVKNNYYPLSTNTLKYQRKGFEVSHPQSSEVIDNPDAVYTPNYEAMVDTVTYTYSKDTIIGGKTYQMFAPPNNYTEGYLIRKENGLYFKMYFSKYQNQTNLVTSELNIFKDDLTIGDEWTDVSTGMTDIYKVIFNKSVITVNGKSYNNVIGIKKVTHRDDDTSEEGLTSIYYYADNKGLIYSYEPYPLSRRYEDDKLYLIE